MNEDVASFYTHLKETTAQLLGYADADNLSASQQIRLERAISLRMICDDTAARQMRGQPIDVKAFTDASKDLERMVGGEPEQTNTGPDYDAAVHQIEALLDGIISDKQRKVAQDPDAARRELEERIARAVEKYGGAGNEMSVPNGQFAQTEHNPASGDAQYTGTVSLPVPVEQAAATAGGCGSASEHPVLIDPPPPPAPPPQPKRESDVERMARVNAQPVPSRYLKSAEPEPWRDYVNSDGTINTSPWRRY